MTTKADQLRTALKAAGFNSKRVSVAHPHGSLRVTIRDLSIPKSAIEAIANPFENVRRDQANGEILAGGNTFLDVVYDRNALRAAARPVAEELARAANDSPNREVTIGGELVVVMAPDAVCWHWTVRAVEDGIGKRLQCYAGNGTRSTVQEADYYMHAAEQLVERQIERASLTPAEHVAVAEDLETPAPVLAPSACRPLAPFPSKTLQWIPRIVRNDESADVREDWAKGI